MALTDVAADKAVLLEIYRQMVLIRRFEEKTAEMYTRGKIGGFLHLYIGEEAVAAGVIPVLAPQDYIVTHYRDHGHAIARGVDTRRVMAELFGKSTGTSKGRGGSMHLFDASKGLLGGYAIVGGMMPIAVGLGLASKYKGEDKLTLCIFGDGAVNEGEFHESLNMAALWKLPVLFLLENNGYGMGTRVSRAHAGKDIWRFAEGYGIPGRQVDGMDILAVRQAAQEAVRHIRSGHGPFFLEATTYRFKGHSMADPLEYRKKDEEEVWKARDPIALFETKLREFGILNERLEAEIEKTVEDEVDAAVAFADQSPVLSKDAMFDDIYAK